MSNQIVSIKQIQRDANRIIKVFDTSGAKDAAKLVRACLRIRKYSGLQRRTLAHTIVELL